MGQEICFSSKVPRPALRPAQHPLQWASGAPSHGRKTTEREPDHLPLSSAEFKNTWSHASTPPHAFMACILLFAGFCNLNAIISITGQPTSTILHQRYRFTNCIKTEQFSYFPKTCGFRFMECASPSLNDKEGKKYMPTDERPQLHLNYTFNFFSRITRMCGNRRVRYSVDAAGTQEGHLNYKGQSLTGQTLELLGCLQNFLMSVASVHKSHTITDLNVQPGVDPVSATRRTETKTHHSTTKTCHSSLSHQHPFHNPS